MTESRIKTHPTGKTTSNSFVSKNLEPRGYDGAASKLLQASEL